jgi:N-acetylglucosaminyldiphosphoundecaprenol N-acetyl-beta-D-mannosaminyltransferase
MEEVLSIVARSIETKNRLLIGVVNAAKLVNMRRDSVLRDAVLKSDLILADGMSVVWASRILGRRLPERVPGIDLMHAMLRHGQQHNYRVYCFGATQEVLEATVAKFNAWYPDVVIVGKRNGYFKPEEEPKIVEHIRAAQPDILLVAMSPPKKEVFLARWSDELDVPVCHGVGGAFDVVAGKTKRAPLSWQRLGLEWLYRVVQEPGRMWRRYLVTNTLFCGMILREFMLGSRPSDDNADTSEVRLK